MPPEPLLSRVQSRFTCNRLRCIRLARFSATCASLVREDSTIGKAANRGMPAAHRIGAQRDDAVLQLPLQVASAKLSDIELRCEMSNRMVYDTEQFSCTGTSRAMPD